MVLRCGLLSVLLLWAGCGSDDGDVGDGGGGGDGSTPETGPATPPDIPWHEAATGTVSLDVRPPTMTPCADGWREVESETGIVTCDPWPEGGAMDCSPGEAHFPGGGGCEPIGGACPSGIFGDALPTDRPIVYVLAGATGGDGTEATPFGSVRDAVRMAPSGGAVAVGAGTYVEEIQMRPGIAVFGLCPARTILRSDAPAVLSGVVTASVADVELHDLSIADSARPGIFLQGPPSSPASMELSAVEIRGATSSALIVADARLNATDLVVRETQASPDGTGGRGIAIQLTGDVSIVRGVFERSREVGVFVGGDRARASLDGVAVRDTSSNLRDFTGGWGVAAQAGATADLSRSVVQASHDGGVVVIAGSTLTLDQVVVRDTEPQALDGGGGEGIAGGDGTIELRGVLLDDNTGLGVGVEGSGGSLMATDVVIRATRSYSLQPDASVGFSVAGGATGTLTRAILEENHGKGIGLFDSGTDFVGQDLVVRDTQSVARLLTYGHGISAVMGASAHVSRVILERNREVGAVAGGEGSEIEARDIIVRDTRSREAEPILGLGLSYQEGARLDVQRAVVEGCREVGVVAQEGGSLVLRDSVIRDTLPRELDGSGGNGLSIAFGAQATIERVRLDRNHSTAVLVDGPETSATFTDLIATETLLEVDTQRHGSGLQVQAGAMVSGSGLLIEDSTEVGLGAIEGGARVDVTDAAIRRTRSRPCEATGCTGLIYGIGVGAFIDAAVSIRDFTVEDAELCGLYIGESSTVDAVEGRVTGSQIGACVADGTYDIGRITTDVQYAGNGVNLDATTLPVPEPIPPNVDL